MLLDQIIRLWAAEFGPQELHVRDLLRRASRPLLGMLQRVAADPNDPQQISSTRLGIWLSENRGRAVAGWKFECRTLHKQAAWRIIEAPFEAASAVVTSPAVNVMPIERPDLSPAEKLEANLSTALDVQGQVLAMGVDRDNLKATRIVAETAQNTVTAALRVSESALQTKKDDEVLARILAALAEEREKLRAAGDYVEPPHDPKQTALTMARLPHLFGAEAAAKALTDLSEEDRAEVIAEIERRR
jgi:hypothetical protein